MAMSGGELMNLFADGDVTALDGPHLGGLPTTITATGKVTGLLRKSSKYLCLLRLDTREIHHYDRSRNAEQCSALRLNGGLPGVGATPPSA
jgi:hypothetical protein